MNKDNIVQFVHSIDDTITVIFSDLYESDMVDKILYVGNTKNNDFNELYKYLYLDSGYNYHNYCSYNTFVLLHEIGHIMCSDTYDNLEDELSLYQYQRLINLNDKELSIYTKIVNYMNLQLEKDANDWAYRYLLANTYKIKKLENRHGITE